MNMYEQTMRVDFPELYEMIMSNLQSQHIHSYDVQANMKEIESGYEVILHFGDGYVQRKSEYFTQKEIESLDTSIVEFVQDTAGKIKEVMVNDYFKMVKP